MIITIKIKKNKTTNKEHNNVVNSYKLYRLIVLNEKFIGWSLRRKSSKNLILGRYIVTFSSFVSTLEKETDEDEEDEEKEKEGEGFEAQA